MGPYGKISFNRQILYFKFRFSRTKPKCISRYACITIIILIIFPLLQWFLQFLLQYYFKLSYPMDYFIHVINKLQTNWNLVVKLKFILLIQISCSFNLYLYNNNFYFAAVGWCLTESTLTTVLHRHMKCRRSNVTNEHITHYLHKFILSSMKVVCKKVLQFVLICFKLHTSCESFLIFLG